MGISPFSPFFSVMGFFLFPLFLVHRRRSVSQQAGQVPTCLGSFFLFLSFDSSSLGVSSRRVRKAREDESEPLPPSSPLLFCEVSFFFPLRWWRRFRREVFHDPDSTLSFFFTSLLSLFSPVPAGLASRVRSRLPPFSPCRFFSLNRARRVLFIFFFFFPTVFFFPFFFPLACFEARRISCLFFFLFLFPTAGDRPRSRKGHILPSPPSSSPPFPLVCVAARHQTSTPTARSSSFFSFLRPFLFFAALLNRMS